MKSVTWVGCGLMALLLMAAGGGGAAEKKADASVEKPAVLETQAQRAQRLQWWREGRFGMFIHWGPISLKGTEISWSRANTNPACPNKGKIPAEEYDNLYKKFNPTGFDAKAWVALAWAAGMKYIVFTAKHCDGFLNWHSKVDGYNISATPFKRDVCGELAQAAHEAGMPIGWYFSPMDWRDPEFRTDRNPQFLERMQGEIRELLGNYGRISVMWFDWDGRKPLYDQARTYPLVKSLQPEIIMTNRLDLGPGDTNKKILSPYADYYTPEQELGSYDDARPWETCMTIGTQWAWKPNDEVKSLAECLRNLVRCVGGDGNLLFNVGPMPDGRIEPRQAETLKGMGAWLAKYGQSVYGTRGGPFKPWKFGASTRQGKMVYVHVFNWIEERVKLPALSAKIVRATLPDGGSVTANQTDKGIEIEVPVAGRQAIDTVIALELDRDAGALPAVEVGGWVSLTKGKKATASVGYGNLPTYAADKAVDGRDNTRWATPKGTRQAWLEVDLGKPVTFDRALIAEAFPCRVQSFEMQYRDGEAWKTFYKGKTLGELWTQAFEPVTARQVRLSVLDATDGPTIWEFQLFAAKQ